jgi:hypothetical protein
MASVSIQAVPLNVEPATKHAATAAGNESVTMQNRCCMLVGRFLIIRDTLYYTIKIMTITTATLITGIC